MAPPFQRPPNLLNLGKLYFRVPTASCVLRLAPKPRLYYMLEDFHPVLSDSSDLRNITIDMQHSNVIFDLMNLASTRYFLKFACSKHRSRPSRLPGFLRPGGTKLSTKRRHLSSFDLYLTPSLTLPPKAFPSSSRSSLIFSLRLLLDWSSVR